MMKIRYYLYRIKWHLAAFVKFKKPVHIDLELNNNCNQSCIMCWHCSKDTPFEKHTSSDISLLDIEKIRSSGAKSIKLNWRGEPLLYKSLFWVSKVLSYRFVEVCMNTNGILLSKQVEEINRSGITKVIISVDSFNMATYQKIHNCDQSHFVSLLKSLRMLYENRYKLNYDVVLNFHINQYNKNEKIKNKFTKYFKVVKRNTEKRYGKDISIVKKERKRKKTCPHMMRRLTIAANGRVFPCCVAYEEPVDLCLGNIKNNTIDQIWNSWRRKRIIDNYKKGKYVRSCKNCTSGDIWKS